MTTTVMATETEGEGSGGRLVTVDGKTLPLRGARLRADACAGVARAVLEQRFVNPYDTPLQVTYLMPLPADGAVSGYAFTIGEKRIVGEVDRKKAARERFERAILEGRTAGLVEQERSSLFTQELGNIPPGAEVIAEITVDQKLAWLDEGAWEWRFPMAAGPRYTGAPGRVPDAAKTEIAVADGPLPARLRLALTVRDRLPDGRTPESPVLRVAARDLADGSWSVELADEDGARLDRDVVVRWAATAPKVGVRVDAGRPARAAVADAVYALLTMVPPAPGAAEARPRKRDLILLLDTSGSMGGEPLAQVKKICAALVDSLGDDDHIELIEFSTSARRFDRKPRAATAKHRAAAKAWLAALQAGGGTEMVSGVLEALAPLSPEAQRQVVLLTDGYIGFEQEVVAKVLERLPSGSRLHVVGVGSAVNRSLTAPAARAGRGVEVVIAPGEDPERAARRLLARTAMPIVTDVEIRGEALVAAAPAKLPDLYAGAPALAALKLRPEGGELVVRGRTAFGTWEQRVTVPARAAGEGSQVAATLWARESVEDLELRRAAGAGDAEAIDGQIETLGLQHQIATRRTTWIAVSQEVTVDPTAPTRREIVPQELPHGVSADGLGLRGGAAVPAAAPAGMPMLAMAGAPLPSMMAPPAPPSPAQAPRTRAAGGVIGGAAKAAAGMLGRVFKKEAERAEAQDEGEGGGVGEAFDDELEIALPAEPAPAEEKAKAPAKPPMRPSPAPVVRPTRRLRAKVRLVEAGRLVVEVTVDGMTLDWAITGAVTVFFRGGASVSATVDAAATTRAQSLAPGQAFRLALDFPAQAGGAERIVLATPAGPLELELTA